MMVLPSLSCANWCTRWTVSSDVSSHGMISTNGSTVAGLKKCIPMTRSGLGVTAASFMIGMDDVLLVSSASARTTLPKAAKIAVLASSSSIAASATRSHSERSSNASVNRTRSRIALRSSSGSLPLRTALSSEAVRRARAPSTAASFTSRKTTSQPLRAVTSAMPAPMMPPPTIPTTLIISLLPDADCPRRPSSSRSSGAGRAWLSVLDLRYVAQFIGCRRAESEELQVRRDLLEQHIGTDLRVAAALLRGPQKRCDRGFHHDLADERGRGDQVHVDGQWVALVHTEGRRVHDEVVAGGIGGPGLHIEFGVVRGQSAAERFGRVGHGIDQTHSRHACGRQRRRDRRPDPTGTDDQCAGVIQVASLA